MGVKKLEELVTLQVALEMKLEIYRLVNEHPAAARDYKFRDQIFEAAKSVENNIAEGYGRFLAGDIVRHLRIAQGSNLETKRCVKDGVHRGHYPEKSTHRALELIERVGQLLTRFIVSLLPFVKQRTKEGRLRDQKNRSMDSRDRTEITSQKPHGTRDDGRWTWDDGRRLVIHL